MIVDGDGSELLFTAGSGACSLRHPATSPPSYAWVTAAFTETLGLTDIQLNVPRNRLSVMRKFRNGNETRYVYLPDGMLDHVVDTVA